MKQYQTIVEDNMVIVIFRPKTRPEKIRVHNIQEFVYGQMHYNDYTEKYPDYVHEEVWKKWEANKKQDYKG